MTNVYLDYAAATPLHPDVLQAMLPYFSDEFANPSSRHSKGQNAKVALDKSRETIAKYLNCKSSEIIFTGSGTESNNLAIFGTALANPGSHLITSTIEHHSILNCCKKLEEQGFTVTYLKPTKEGFITPESLEKAITDSTSLISIHYANNEIGTIQDIAKLAQLKKQATFHSDACQAPNTLTLNTAELNVDLLTINGSKIYGPKGVGALFVKKGIKLQAQTLGGHQEKSLRAGTHNLPGIVGFAKALELAQENREKENARLINLRDILIKEIETKIPTSKLNGSHEKRLANNINLSFPGIDGQELLLHLDAVEIYCSTASACTVGTETPSHVLTALELSDKEIQGSIRITLGKETTEENIYYTVEKLVEITQNLLKY